MPHIYHLTIFSCMYHYKRQPSARSIVKNCIVTGTQMDCEHCGGELSHADGARACSLCGTVVYEQVFHTEAVAAHDEVYDNCIGRLRVGTFCRGEHGCMRNVRRYAARSECASYRTRMLCKGYDEIERVTKLLGMTVAVASVSRKLYAHVTQQRRFMYRRRGPIIAGVIAHACRQQSSRPCIQDVCAAMCVTRKAVFAVLDDIEDVCCALEAVDMIPSICARLGASRRTARNAIALHARRIPEGDAGFRPSSVAAACITAVMPASVTKAAIAKRCGVSSVTLAKCVNHFGLCAQADQCLRRVA